jgi:hypothetical protein
LCDGTSDLLLEALFELVIGVSRRSDSRRNLLLLGPAFLRD